MERAELKAVLRATGVAVERGGITFLCDPHASAAERTEAQVLMAARPTDLDADFGWVCVRTGGSGGAVKFTRHDELSFGAAVTGFVTHFGIKRVNAVDVLPAHHVSGLMARVRCAATGGQHVAWDWKRLEAADLPALSGDEWVISLVPTQLQRVLDSASTVEWLRRFTTIFVSGGPVWPDLADAAAGAKLRVSLCYGMTETAAMVAALRPVEFLAGARSCGRVMPHAQIEINPLENLIAIAGDSLFRGYWPDRREARAFTTDDIGRIDEQGHLHVLGRRDAMIITGGRKVNAAEIETALRESGEFVEIAVFGIADREWGETVVACYPRDASREPDLARAVERLAGYQRPKRFFSITEWPRNEQGKVNRAALRAAIQRQKEAN